MAAKQYLGYLGKALDWWGHHQRWWWTILIMVMLTWFGYDLGQMVTRAGLLSLGTPTSGAITVPELMERTRSGQGGRVIVTGQTSASFVDSAGRSWGVSDFGDEVTRNDLNLLKARHVVVDGAVNISVNPVKASPSDLLLATFSDLAVKLAFIGFYGFLAFFLMRMLRGGGQARFRRIAGKHSSGTTLDDVAGYAGPKQEVAEICEYLRNPAPYRKVGARPASGVLMYGPPGTGKTLMAKAIAGEAHAAFFEQSGASFVRIYAGAGASSVRALFAQARKHRPAVIFIDELDAIGSSRDEAGSHREHKQTLDQLLVEMGGFDGNEGIMVIAATNRIDALDPALLRPGRFDRKVFVGPPSREDRLAILRRHAARLPSVSADLGVWATRTPGFVGADLEALVNEAAVEAARVRHDVVSDLDFAAARDRVLIGARDHGRRLLDSERRVVACHELGHAIVRLLVGGKVEKISILPRGQALGVTVSDATESSLQTGAAISNELAVLMGGRAAEQAIVGEVTTGAADDIARASSVAREAVRRLGGAAQSPGVYLPEGRALIEEQERQAAEWVNAAYQDALGKVEASREVLLAMLPRLLEQDEIDGSVLAEALHHAPTPRLLQGDRDEPQPSA